MAPVADDPVLNPKERGVWNMRNVLAVGTLTFAAGLAGCGSPADRMVDKPAPDFTLTSLGGETVSLSGYRGKAVLLAFFGCG